jgi:hypothetical protein
MNSFNVMGYELSPTKAVLLAIIVIWTIFWKGLALWHSVKRGDKRWFIFILILNTFSILELIYLFYIVKIKSIKLD